LPLAFQLTGGEASDSRNFEILLDLGPDITPRAAITDKGYDAKANRDGARRRGICPVIPYKSNAINRPAFFPKALYKARARIEQAVGKLKRFKRIALRCEKTASNYGSFVALALGFILIKSVHRPRLALLWQILGGAGFPNQFFCDSWVVGFWRGRPWLRGRWIGETSLGVGSSRFWLAWATRRGDRCVRSTCRV
jgi:transposase